MAIPGTRGATSAEYFLQHGYAVIFMHRQYSLQPFSRHYSHSLNPFLDFLEMAPSPDGSDSPPTEVHVSAPTLPHLIPILKTYKDVHKLGTLHSLTFVTVDDYLFLLRAISKELSQLGGNVIYYLAAAVSDFFLPTQKMVSDHPE
jgi:phosphopantothenate-cysteine ligase